MKKVFLAIAVASVFTACNSGEGTATEAVKAVDSTVQAVDSTVKAVDSTVKAVDSTVKAVVDSVKK
jgi:methyl-accepting chemotaxis protein